MEVIIGKNAGFCYGVERAVNTTKKELESVEEIYCLGELVHNSRVIKDLEQRGLKTIENFENGNKKIIIRAHGISKNVYEQAKNNNIELVDLTCPNVLKIHKIIEEHVLDNYYIFLIGSKKHPETIGSFSYAGENGFVIETEDDIQIGYDNFIKSQKQKLLIIVQTTFSLSKFNSLVDNIKDKIKAKNNIILEIKNTICNATKIRQEETEELSKMVDCVIIIGGRNSSNTKKLYEIANKNCENTFLIECVKELENVNMLVYKKIGIMAGASTPQISIDEVVCTIENY